MCHVQGPSNTLISCQIMCTPLYLLSKLCKPDVLRPHGDTPRSKGQRPGKHKENPRPKPLLGIKNTGPGIQNTCQDKTHKYKFMKIIDFHVFSDIFQCILMYFLHPFYMLACFLICICCMCLRFSRISCLVLYFPINDN